MSHCLPPDICFLCLSRNRTTFTLSANFHNLFDFLTDWYPQTDARVCWECRATLEKLRRFKEQAERAVCALERARTGLQPMSFECLSKVYGTQMLVIDLLVYDNANVITTNDSSVDISKNEICKAYEVEVEFEDEIPKIKDKITEEVDLDVDIIYENIIPDHTAEDDNDSDVGSNCLMIDLTKDDTENAIQDNTKQINLPPSTLQIDSPSTSAENSTSKNEKNSSAIKKARGAVKTKVKKARCNVKTKMKHKKQMVRKIKKKLTTAEILVNKERRAEEQKYRLFQKGKAFECDHCGKKCVKRQKLIKHMKSHYKNVMCDQCGFKCTAHWVLRKHMLAHLDPSYRAHECKLCPKRFIDKYKLLVHTRRHTGERPFKCDNCEKSFACKETLTAHIKEKHTERDTLVKKRISQPRTKSLYRSYTYNGMATRHYRNYKIINDSENITYECNICQQIFPNHNMFYMHYISAHKENSFHCAECNKSFKWNWQLTRHVKLVHKGEKPYQCNICGLRCTTKQRLQVHIGSHSNERRFKCNECLATFKYPNSLHYHKLIHKGVKPHECNICEARFTVKSNLVGHMKVHTKDRPYECDICSKKFPWKRNLKNHLKTH